MKSRRWKTAWRLLRTFYYFHGGKVGGLLPHHPERKCIVYAEKYWFVSGRYYTEYERTSFTYNKSNWLSNANCFNIVSYPFMSVSITSIILTSRFKDSSVCGEHGKSMSVFDLRIPLIRLEIVLFKEHNIVPSIEQ